MTTSRPSRRSSRFLIAIAALVLGAAPLAVRAETSFGLRGGLSVDPDQFLIGGHINFSPIAENVYIVPSAEAGFGDDIFTLSFNGDVQYRFDTDSGVRPYAGGGLSLYFVDFDGGSDTELGVAVLGGFFFNQHSDTPMFVEAKAGLTDEVPDWKFIFGVNF